ncbi:Transcription factor bHLH35 [Acorus calamus]|uniref:Transcription factor bHLH35 n=1 Tax=Acorus calamus TaxID=4465 RepID=A0AAV9CAS7_ACOCL|nr:Transcription factor bHLH35 [Acorus calamus]
METEFEAYQQYPFHDPTMAPMPPASLQGFSSTFDSLSSWLEDFETHDPFIPSIHHNAPPTFEDHDLFHHQYMASEASSGATAITGPLDETLDSLLLDLCNGFPDPIQPEHAPAVMVTDGANQFLNDESGLTAPSTTSPESFVDQFFFGSSQNSSPEENMEDEKREEEEERLKKKQKRRAVEEEEEEEEEDEEEEEEEEGTDGEGHKPRGLNCKNLLSERNRRKRLSQQLLALRSLVPNITKIDTEKIEDRRFVVKITCKEGLGVGGEVLRVIESLGFEITYTSLDQIKPQHVLTTVFVRIKKPGRMTEEKLKDCITSTALRSGLSLQNP